MTPERITALITRAGITVYRLAELVHISPSSVYAWRDGKREPKGTQLGAIRRAESLVKQGVDLRKKKGEKDVDLYVDSI